MDRVDGIGLIPSRVYEYGWEGLSPHLNLFQYADSVLDSTVLLESDIKYVDRR